jgi:hypothetical protein
MVEVRLLDTRRKPIDTGFRKRLAPGTHEVTVNTSGVRNRDVHNQIFIDGAPRSAPMLLLRRA